jgi:hypothetical protein
MSLRQPGGGLEIAACCHVRIAEPDTQFRLPEGQRGIFVVGGATVRLSRIIGAHRLTEMEADRRLSGSTPRKRTFSVAGLRSRVGPKRTHSR